MGLLSHANTRDANEPEIVELFEKLGASVWRMDTPCDLLVGDVVRVPALVSEIRRRHTCGNYGGKPYCEMCTDLEVMAWPCDAIRAAEAIERLCGPRTYPVEVKFENGKFTPLQQRFNASHKGELYVARSIEDAADLLAQWRNSAIYSKDCRP